MVGRSPPPIRGPILAAVGRFVESDAAARAAAPATSARRRSGKGAARRRGRRPSHHGVHYLGIALRNRQVRLRNRRQTGGQRPPVGAAVGGFEDAAAGAGKRPVLHEPLLLLPQGGIDNVGVLGIDAHVVAARVFVLEEHLVEGGAAVGGAEDATLGI